MTLEPCRILSACPRGRPERGLGSGTLSLALAALIATGCARESASGDATIDGDSPVVRSSGAGEWAEPPRLVQELRIGRLEGADEYLFGNVNALAVGRDGTIYVVDSQGPRLRMYDAEGLYRGQIGRPGGGPGEYRMINGVAITPSGDVAILDVAQRRITVYDPGGELLRTLDSGVGGNWTSNSFHIDPAGNFYVFGIHVNPSAPPEPGAEVPLEGPVGRRERIYLKLSPEGEVLDTLAAPASTRPRQPSFLVLSAEGVAEPFVNDLVYDLTREGGFATGYTDENYAFEIARPDGSILRIEREYEPVPLRGEERAQWQALADFISRNPDAASAGVRIPDVKPAFRGIEVDEDGRIWVHRYAEATERPRRTDRPTDAPPQVTWRDIPTFDVFEEDGRFLGTVVPPPSTRMLVRQGNQLWGVQRGALDENYLVRYRMEVGPP